MAQMYPRALLDDDVKSRGETKVFHALEAGLDDAWEVFHSVGWIRRDPGVGARDGEIDFVVAHPDRGIVCLEVKGGDLECRHGEWLRRGDGGWERLRDPFAQALDHRYELTRMIDRVPRLARPRPAAGAGGCAAGHSRALVGAGAGCAAGADPRPSCVR